MSLSVEQFSEFHHAVHGRPAFEWQSRLLRTVVDSRAWPRVLDLPTGAGKTTCIDIALFALALDSQDGQTSWCPRRIAMVVDRRVVVDQVAERGRKLLRAHLDPKAAPIVVEVARRLRSLSKTGTEPLGVFTLRGGVPKDDGWARTPDQPLILASTVDQIGSRLLLQGYGVSQGMKPIHAGLLGNDTLLLLDEVHLSQPFAETLDQLAELRAKFAGSTGLAPRFAHAFLSATPGASVPGSFRLEDDEKREASPLGERLHAKKPVRIEAGEDRVGVEHVCVQQARELIGRHDVVAVVMNRVASALTVARQLGEAFGESVTVVPLTGRMRPLDRDDVLRTLRPRIMTGRERPAAQGKLVVVGTQCIEAGADFDFDALVTEAASLDALRQRFGRVDRLGLYCAAEGVIVRDKKAKEDPIYGAAIAHTMKWLTEKLDRRTKTVDFGVLALPLPPGEELLACLAPKEQAPIMLPAYLDLWMQTSPPPMVVPDVSLWLHGPQSGPADVQVIWRLDLGEADLSANARPGASAAEIVGSVRPSSLEAISLPFVAARDWLLQKRSPDVADVEGDQEVEASEENAPGLLAVRWAGKDTEVISAADLRPGDTIVVPCSRGGLWKGCFDGASTGLATPVGDLAERAALFSRGQAVLRTHPAVLAALQLPAMAESEEPEVRALLVECASNAETSSWTALWLKHLAGYGPTIAVEGDPGWLVLHARRRVSARELHAVLRADDSLEDGVELTTDDDDSPHAGSPVALSRHSGDVERFARTYAQGVGLPPGLVGDLALAGWLHDIGKADRRFQVMLRGGSEISFFRDETPWAKSGMAREAMAAHREAQRRSGYPVGARHEVQSVAMIESIREQLAAKAQDLELVVYLVGSHHGYCRPFAPAAPDEQPIDVSLTAHSSTAFGQLSFPPASSASNLHRVDSPLADRFWALVSKYGWLELCWLETILRLADHRASEEEQEGAL